MSELESLKRDRGEVFFTPTSSHPHSEHAKATRFTKTSSPRSLFAHFGFHLLRCGSSLQEMAPRKLPAKRSRKDTAGEGSNVAPQTDVDFDRHRFRSAEH